MEDSPAKPNGRTHFRRSQYVNRRHGHSGHLWQDRSFSGGQDEVHMWPALCYIERDPVRAKMVWDAWRYLWPSAAANGKSRVVATRRPTFRGPIMDSNSAQEQLKRYFGRHTIVRLGTAIRKMPNPGSLFDQAVAAGKSRLHSGDESPIVFCCSAAGHKGNVY